MLSGAPPSFGGISKVACRRGYISHPISLVLRGKGGGGMSGRMDRWNPKRPDGYTVSMPHLSKAESHFCNVITAAGPGTPNCMRLRQGGGCATPLFGCVWIMTQIDTNHGSVGLGY